METVKANFVGVFPVWSVHRLVRRTVRSRHRRRADSIAVFNALPYILTVILLAGFVGKSIAPKAVGRPYVKRTLIQRNIRRTGMIINFGSINIDHVYRVPRRRAGRNTNPTAYSKRPGGKGFNQSIALFARVPIFATSAASAPTTRMQALWLHTQMKPIGNWIYRAFKALIPPLGHALIQVNDEGENCIFLAGALSGRAQIDAEL